jgi:hypothetical protein
LGYSVVLVAYVVVALYAFWGSGTKGEPVVDAV